ncbi:MAG: UDP-N-acetyl-alpha-D-muramoyl-L-alanyl-L-glutamate epimerase [Rudaea sp.]|uniref:UDP-N-acetyl-alpha-D-muramoyl-L-alanyl-L- glutamate epimerase n=1 Tax=Rudaea sp. TaxID=2136325 RepID=UPI0039E5EA13
MTLPAADRFADPRNARVFRFASCDFDAASGTASLSYAFDDGPLLTERIVFPAAPALPAGRATAFAQALRLLHLIAGVSYYKAGIAPELRVETGALAADTAVFLHELYFNGLAEFAYQNKLDLSERLASLIPPGEGAPKGRMREEPSKAEVAPASAAPFPHPPFGHLLPVGEGKKLNLPRRTLLPIGGGKDSLVSAELCKSIGEPATAVWIGDSALIAACAERTGLPRLDIGRHIALELFEYNRRGAYNGHVPVTAINSAILVCAAILYGYDAIAFSNERSASSATLEYLGRPINHQWSKSLDFERLLRYQIHAHVAADLDYFSLLRPWSELDVAREFARHSQYDAAFSSCNRNFRILGGHPSDRWCGQCPKCHFVFLALAPFVAKPRLLKIFGRNLLDDATLAPGFDALLEYRDHKPFECVGEGRESRAAMYALTQRAEWREDALVARFAKEILPQLDRAGLALEPLLASAGEHFVPSRFAAATNAPR